MNILVCAPTGHFADDVPATCADCRRSIVHRPHVPPDFVKLCESCAAGRVIADGRVPEIRVTEETLREVALFNAKTKGTQ